MQEMEKRIKTGRVFYGISMAIGFQQFFYSDFHQMILPPLHNGIPGLAILAWITDTALLAAGAATLITDILASGGAEKELALSGGAFVIAGSFAIADGHCRKSKT